MKQQIKTLCFILLFGLISPSAVYAQGEEVSFKSSVEGKVAIYEDHIVWMSYESGNWDVYYMNKSTKAQKNITNDPNTQGYPDVWEDYIVYQDNKNHIEDKTKYFDIYLYDLNTGKEKKISNTEGDHQAPVIVDNKVVWVDHKGGKKDVILYDIEKGISRKVSSDNAQAFGVTFDGRIIAWMDTRNGNFDIYIYDILEGKEKRITYSLQNEVDPIISNGKVVWMVGYNGYSQIYMYDIENDVEKRLTAGEENHRPIAFSGDQLILIENDKLVLNNVEEMVDYPLNYQAQAIPKQAFLIEEEVVLFDGDILKSDSLDNLLKEVTEEENKIPETNKSLTEDEDTEKIAEQYNKNFYDMHNHWANEIVKVMAARNIINGYEDGSFRPDKAMTRAEFIKILVSSMNEETLNNAETNFTDVSKDFWAFSYINTAYQKGWVSGYDGKFNPNDEITREQMITILMRFYKGINKDTVLEKENLDIYNDKNQISSWAKDSIGEAVKLGLIKGYDNLLSPIKNATRAEAATMLYRYLENLKRW